MKREIQRVKVAYEIYRDPNFAFEMNRFSIVNNRKLTEKQKDELTRKNIEFLEEKRNDNRKIRIGY